MSLHSFQQVLERVMDYFDKYGGCVVLYLTIFSERNWYFVFVLFFDWTSQIVKNWYFEHNFMNPNYLYAHWIKKLLIIPM